MKYLMPTHLDDGTTHCAIQAQTLIEIIKLKWYLFKYKDRFHPENKSKWYKWEDIVFCRIDTEWFNENVKSTNIANGIIDN